MIRNFPLQIPFDDIDNALFHELYSARHHGKHKYFRYGIDGILKVLKRHEEHLALRRLCSELHYNTRHYSERSLRSGYKLCEVISRRRFYELSARPDYLAVREHRLDSKNVMPGNAVLNRIHTARIGRYVPPDCRFHFTGE